MDYALTKKLLGLFLALSFPATAALRPPILAVTLNEPRTTDSLALVALYDSANGANWTTKTNWKTSNPIDTWYGVSVSSGRVTHLDLTYNNLTGKLTSAIGDLTGLISLKLGSNYMTGSIPGTIGNMTSLEELYIHANQFTGTIPTSVGNLSNLRILFLQLNGLTGAVPMEIGNLSQVTLITVSGNDLSDSIPSQLGNLGNLTGLYLNGNNFSGSIPPAFGNLTNLQYLTLSNNQLSGSIPAELGSLSQLEWLWLADNHLSGTIPSQLGNLTHLRQLYLDHNTLSGSLPSLTTLTSLEELRIQSNRIDVLPDLTSITSLINLIIDHNQFTFEDIEPNIDAPSSTFTYSPQDSVGSYKDTTAVSGSSFECAVSVGGDHNQYQWYKNGSIIGGATSASYTIPSVTYLDSGTYHCRITNTVATALTLYSRTFKLHVIPSLRTTDSLALVALYDSTGGPNWTNKTNWKSSNPIDTWFGVTLSGGRVASIVLTSNNLVGHIPAAIGNLNSLTYLFLSSNQLSGTIPPQLWSLNSLDHLSLGFNKFSPWSIPISIFNMTSLIQLDLAGDSLVGTIPSQIGDLTNLTALSLQYNQLDGTIPTEIVGLANLQLLDFGHNHLVGTIPTDIGSMTNLRNLHMEGNQLTGTVPTQMGSLTNLQELWLGNNQLTGTIPIQLGNLTSLYYLDLSANGLSGSIPAEIGNLTALTYLYLAQNKLTGVVPNLNTLTSLEDLRLSGNQLTGLPDLSSLTSLNQLFVENNKLTFEDIEPNIGGPNTQFTYSPQDSVGTYKDTTVSTGSAIEMSVILGGTSNQYQWYKNGNVINGATSATYAIPSPNAMNSGVYHCQIANSVATDLTLYSRTHTLHVTPVTTGGLIAYYPLNGNARDTSGNSVHGIINEAIPVPDRFGNSVGAMYFDGSNDYIQAPADLLPTATRTVSAWFYANSLDKPVIWAYGGDGGATSIFLALNLSNTNNMVAESHFATYQLSYAYTTPPAQQWYHVVLTIDPAGSKMYLNGNMVASNTSYNDYTVVAGRSLFLGTCIDGNGTQPYSDPAVGYFNGALDDVAFYNRALTAEEIDSLYHVAGWAAPPPVITSFTPTSGPIGTSVAITGTNFNTTAFNNVVYFGAVKAQVTNAASTELTVIVPTGTTYAPITVTDTTTGLTAYSSKPFVVTFPSSQVIDATSFASKVDFTAGAAPYTVAVGDLDGDGKPDVAVANEGSGMLSIFRNTSTTGSCDFATKADFATGVSPRGVAVGDVDGDGKPDVVVTNNGGTTISVYRNTSTIGAITLDPKVDFAMGNGPNTVAIGDVDGDGKADLVVASEFSSGMISIFRNTGNVGTISFAAKVDSLTGSGPWGVAIGDLDGDGKPDIVNANAGNNTISVFRNTSTGGSISLDPKVDFATGSYPLGVAIGDVDADGKPDVVVTNYSGATVSVFRNTSTSGSISLDVKADFATGSVPAGVALGDMDGDGKADIATANYSSSTVSVLRNTSSSGTIGLAGKVDFATGSAPVGVVISDMDGDGKPDLAATNQGSSTVSVLRNTSLSGRALDSLALVDLYDSTGGDNWTNKTNWKTSNPIDTWYGVTLSGNRVYSISLLNNNLAGILPASIGNLSSLYELDLWTNHLIGNIPSTIGNMQGLNQLNLASNQITGSIPPEIGNLTNLMSINLVSNLLSGSIPVEFGNLSNLEYLYLRRNALSGSIPSSLGNASNLKVLGLGYNQLSGFIPSEIGNLVKLEMLNLPYNQLTGAVPTSLTILPYLNQVRLTANGLTDLPDFTGLDSLKELSIDSNRFTFEDIEPNIGAASQTFTYSPQDSIGTYSTLTMLQGTAETLSVDVGGENNRYQWMKNGVDITGATSNEYYKLYWDVPDSGNYVCRITNTVATELTLYSRPARVIVYPMPTQPGNLVATPVSSSRIDLSWTASSNATKYNIFQSLTSGSGFNVIDSVSVPATSYSNTGLSVNTTYYYRIYAANQYGATSSNSNEASATTLGIAPTLGTPNVSNPSPIPSAAVTITVTATGTSPTVKLLYGKTTQTEGDSLTMTYNGINYSGTIPGSSVTQEGVWYRIRAQNTGGVVYYPATSRASISVTINDIATIWDNSHFYGGIPKEQYFTIAMSMDASLSLTGLWGAQILEDGIPTNWRAWEFDQPTQSFVDVTSLSGDKAYFIYHRQGSAQEIFNSATSRKTNDPQMFGNIVLSPQWNAVPWPYTFPANIFVKDLNQDSIGSVWKLWGVSGWEQVTEMRAFGGYMIYNKTGGNVRLGDVVDWTMMAVKPAVDQTEWRLRFIAESGEYRDAFNFAGVSENFTTLSEPEPVSVGKNIGLYFRRGDLTLSGDIRSANEDGHVWDMIVRNTTGKNRTRLTWDMMGALTSDVKVILVDVTNNQCIELDETVPYYEFRNQNQNRFKLVAGKAGYVLNEVNKIKAQLPDEFMLSQNYPNPFNPTTTIKFDVARSGHVRITVYNILGQSVVTLADGYFETGKGYRVTWNGKDVSGREVASGIYICRLESGKFSKVKKMLLVK